MLSLSSLSIRNANSDNATKQARANARMAMMIAIGELQAEMGPDQRVSITADQRSNATDGDVTSSAVGNRHWTGVFNSWPETSDTRPTDMSLSFRSWLVSGDPSRFSQLDAAETELTGADVIELVGEGTLGPAAATGRVKVPVVDNIVNGVTKGRLAWWVGDQGVKAAVKTPLPSTDTSLGVLRNNLQSATRNAIDLSKTGAVKPFGNLAANDPRLERVISWQQAAFLASDIAAPRSLFHDLAATSTGLLTNVRAGGFRKDLSMQMETYTDTPDLTDPKNVLYAVTSSRTGNKEVGVNMMELWAYYHLYEQLESDSSLKYSTGDPVDANTPVLKVKDSIEEIVVDKWDMFKHPLTINYQVVVSFEVGQFLEKTGTTTQDTTNTQIIDKALFVNSDPIVTLWNPLDVAVHIPNFKITNCPRFNTYTYYFDRIPYDFKIGANTYLLSHATKGGFANLDCGNFFDATGKQNQGQKGPGITLKPGEVVMISQAGYTAGNNNRVTVGVNDSNFSEVRVAGRTGFSYGGGTRAVFRDGLTGVLADGSRRLVRRKDAGNPVEFTTPGASFEYSLIPNGSSIGVMHRMGEPWDGRRPYTNMGGAFVDDNYGYSRAQVGQATPDMALRAPRSCPNPFTIRANDVKYQNTFPTIEGAEQTKTVNVDELWTSGEKQPAFLLSFRTKTEVENNRETKMFSRFNPKAPFFNFYDLSEDEQDMLPFEVEIKPVTSFLSAGIEVNPKGQAFFGSSIAAASGSNFVSTHSVPRQPLISLAAFQHSFANGFNRLATSGGTLPTNRGGVDYYFRQPLLPQISHAIGNSLAPSVMPSDKTEYEVLTGAEGGAKYPHPLADHSYLANRALWDDYFLSGITPQKTPAFASIRDQKTVALDFFKDGTKLPVVRYNPDLGGSDATNLVETFFTGITPTPDAIKNVASYIRVDGMFNVNSTSVEAWKAVLGSLKNRPIVVRNENGTESIVEAANNPKTKDKHPVANINAPRDFLLEDGAAAAIGYNQNWDGRRVISDDEIGELAKAIVKEVRKRGPFLSLADFVNRRVGTDVGLARAGAIQCALDSDDVTINKKQNTVRAVDPLVAKHFEFPEAEEGAMHYGAPSLVKQADILTPTAPVLSARSDSFIIRAYGEAVDGNGKVTARAWCEALVERDREYIDPSDTAVTLPASLNPVNKKFGRRFNMISFRWLNASEV
jgi:hypothetical protein